MDRLKNEEHSVQTLLRGVGYVVSILHDERMIYPTLNETDNSLMGISNPISQKMRELLGQCQKGQKDKSLFLEKYIKPGMKVFILCNFVYHRRVKEREVDFLGKCTHGSVVAAIAETCLELVGNNGRVNFGNAPLQSCDFSSVLRDTASDVILKQAKTKRLNIESRDLRSYIVRQTKLGNLVVINNYREKNDQIVEVDLGKSSLLNDVMPNHDGVPKFRIADYNPAYTETYHNINSHKYLIHKDILEADVIINVAKMKTHEKVGVTLGTKGYVGAIASKECLAHHRFGPPSLGGDEYPAYNYFNVLGSKFNEFVFRQNYPPKLSRILQIIDRNYKKLLGLAGKVVDGAWFGNDTAWRMAIDIARICHYADKDGKLNREKQRENLLVIDGIIGGEGNGPLSVRGVNSGVLLFSNNIAAGDKIACKLMGYDYNKIPITREPFGQMEFPIGNNHAPIEIVYNGKQVSEGELRPVLGRPFVPPKHWPISLLL
ncbi:MAG TPA: hypothetical protein DFI01_09485 [Bacteroidales bacterium]|nr:hypothetical protein [Bacteroidales bacterium]